MQKPRINPIYIVCGKNYKGIQLYKNFKLDPQEEKTSKLQLELFKQQQRNERTDTIVICQDSTRFENKPLI